MGEARPRWELGRLVSEEGGFAAASLAGGTNCFPSERTEADHLEVTGPRLAPWRPLPDLQTSVRGGFIPIRSDRAAEVASVLPLEEPCLKDLCPEHELELSNR